MVSGLVLLWARKKYKKDCEEVGKDNLAVSWEERVGAWLACGFWGIDLMILAAIVSVLTAIFK